MNNLIKYGTTSRYFDQATMYPEYSLGRVISQYKDMYKVVTKDGELLCEISGKLRHETLYICDYPAVGDFVMLDRTLDTGGNGIIHKVLPRRTVFERRAVGMTGETQVVASNIDLVFLCMSLNRDYNLSRLERYLSIGWNSGATPVIILTKADLCEDVEGILREISTVASGVDVIVTSGTDGDSYKQLLPYIKEGITASFIGSSGVGKSTLVNRIAGEEIFATSGIRGDDKGRHTTTRRELIVLKTGGVVIDTPGMRELGVDGADMSKTFSDIGELIARCKFSDCSHTSEPGCAVRQAIEDGLLDSRRLENYMKIKKEARYDGMSSKQIETEKLNSMFESVGGMKKARDFIKEKTKRR